MPFDANSLYPSPMFYKPPNLTFQHLPVKEKVGEVEINQMRNGWIIDTLTSVDIRETVKTWRKLIEIYEGSIF